MSFDTATFARPKPTEASRIAPDRRRHKRVALTILGRFMREDKMEYPCKMLDMSVGGAALASPVPVRAGEHIIAYFDTIGGLEGKVARIFESGFAMEFIATQRKREKIAAQLTWLMNRDELQPSDERRHERITPANSTTTLQLAEGILVRVKVVDVSISGASIETEARPMLGNEVVLGRLQAKVVRHHDTGIGVQFLHTQDIKTVSRHFT